MELVQSGKLATVNYDIRGPVMREAVRMEAAGTEVLKLNIGNPAPFGFEAPKNVLDAVAANLGRAHGYCDSKGILEAREAIAEYYAGRGIAGVSVADIWLGNGVSELIQVTLQALLNDGDEILIPAPDYPLWTAAAILAGGRVVHYRCDESAGWQPDLDDLAAKITPRTRGMVIINPNNPTGAVYSRQTVNQMLDLARQHHLVVFSDEIYDKIIYDGVECTSTAALAPDLLCLTFSGLSKAYRVAGFRTGWVALSGPKEHARSYIEGLEVLASMRLCPNVPTQYAVAPALRGYQCINDLVLPSGRLHEQRDATWRLLNEIPGVSCVKPKGALYAFPRIDPDLHPIRDDEQFALDLLREQKVLIVQGTGFNWPTPDHFRIVTLPSVPMLTDAIGRIGAFLSTYRQA